MTQTADSSGVERPRCACHGEPQWRAGKGRLTCAVRERGRNARRVRTKILGEDVFLGRAQSDVELAFVRNFLQRRRVELNGRV